ncbi:cytochrome P450 [Rickenella mellea]|uniref:Cytochrome P450 n=1 Tax=Rickenella mellea TaxID=50990 RepID=A0A4Y7PKZ8_9AGAM|nr:cytochrome P450 [Rickenella mellea]
MLSLAEVGLVLFGVFLVYQLFISRTRKNFPPGPRGYPIIGNLFDMPSGDEVFVWAKWRERWGPLNSVTTLGQTIVVANSYQKAIELCDKKSSIYSERAPMPMAGELVGWKENLAFRPYGKEFRYGRRVYHQEFGNNVSLEKFQPAQDTEACKFLKNLLDKPTDFIKLSAGIAGAMSMRTAYGYEKVDLDFITLVNRVMDTAGVAAAPNSFMVNMVPWLLNIPSWFPGAGFKKIAAKWRHELLTMNQIPWDFVKSQVAAGTALDSFSSRLLREVKSAEDENYIKWLAAGILVGGTDTSYGTILSFFLAMVHNPEVQRKAQAEIDAVVGTDRLPTYADRPHLPYVESLKKEIYRCFVVGPLGIPHMSNADDVHDGYFIPKGAILFTNIWLIAHDPDVYTRPMDFYPERYLGPNPQQDPMDFAFGFGRRICPGRYLADAAVWITMAKLLAAFNVLPPVKNGKSYIPPIEMTPGLVSHPKDFDAIVVPRSVKAVALINASVDQ